MRTELFWDNKQREEAEAYKLYFFLIYSPPLFLVVPSLAIGCQDGFY